MKPCPKCGCKDKIVFFEDNCPCDEQNRLMLGCDKCGIMLRGIEVPNDAEDDYEKEIEKAKTELTKEWDSRSLLRWTSQTPTESGLYLFRTSPHCADPDTVFIFPNSVAGNRLCLENKWREKDDSLFTLLDDFVDLKRRENNWFLQWCKIEKPESESTEY